MSKNSSILARRLAGALALALVGLTAGGCRAVTEWRNPATPIDDLRAALARIESNRELSSLLQRETERILSDPSRMQLLRGMRVSVALVSLGRAGEEVRAQLGSYRGDRRVAAGDLAALPLAAYYFAHARVPRLRDDALLARRIEQMLRGPDATAFNSALDILSDTESGPALEGPAFEEFRRRRGIVNEWLAELDLHPPIKIEQKIWETQPFGRDIQLLGTDYTNENQVGADALAKLLVLVADSRLSPREEPGAMLEALKLDRSRPGQFKDQEIAAQLPITLPVAGYATTRDGRYGNVAVFEAGGGARFALVVLADRETGGRELTRRLTPVLQEAIAAGRVPVPRAPAP